jgi:hypothetical protein
MTPREQLIAKGETYGWGWQTKLAPRFGWSDRTMRRKISGESPITKTEEDAIRRLRPKKRKSAS